MALILDDCEHKRVTLHRATFGRLAYFECQRCGAVTIDIDEDFDEDTGETFYVPVWAYEDSDDAWCEIDGCEEPVRSCSCGAYHCEQHPHNER